MSPRSSMAAFLAAAALAAASPARAAEPALPDALRQSLRRAVAVDDDGARQGALDQLLAWAKAELALPINWSTLASLTYDGGRSGSKTEAEDPLRIKVLIGRSPFGCEGDVYSVFRHELTHVAQQQDSARTVARGWGVEEVEAYLWELDHSAETGLDRCDRRGEDKKLDRTVGAARAMDGLFRYVTVLAREVQQKQSSLTAEELAALDGRVSCAVRDHAAVVREIFPEMDWSQLPACRH